MLDRPFEVGDFIQAGEYMGTVERIGVKTTRVRSLGGEQIVFPNSDLIQSRVRNFQRMTERRVAFRFGVAYDTPAATVERIPGLVRAIVAGLDTDPARPRPLRRVRRVGPELRGGLLRARPRLQPGHEHPAADQPGTPPCSKDSGCGSRCPSPTATSRKPRRRIKIGGETSAEVILRPGGFRP